MTSSSAGGSGSAGRARCRLQLVRHRVALKNQVHATLLAFGGCARLGPWDRLGPRLHIAAELGDITRFASPSRLVGLAL
jgi:hypothetical protein